MADHPYYPPDVVLPGFVPNDISVPVLLTTFASASTLVIWVTSILARTIRPGISKADLFTTIWFMLCGCIHLFFEGLLISDSNAFFSPLPPNNPPHA